MKLLSIAMLVFSFSSASARDWEMGDGYQPCLDRARKGIADFTASAQTWRSALESAQADQPVLYDRLVRLASAINSTVETRNQILAQNQRALADYKSVNANLEPQRKQFQALRSARLAADRDIPQLILNLRRTIEATDEDLDREISSLMTQIRNAKLSTEKVKLKARLDRTLSLKTFRTRVGGPGMAGRLFNAYISGKDDQAEQLISPTYRPLLESARSAFQSYSRVVKDLADAEDSANRRVLELTSELDCYNATLNKTHEEWHRLEKIENSDRSAYDITQTRYKATVADIPRYQAGLNRETDGLARAQQNLDSGCYLGHRHWRRENMKDGGTL